MRNPDHTRIPVRAVLLDAGGVIVLPRGEFVAAALARIGIAVDPAAVPPAHYRAVRRLEAGVADAASDGYLGLLCRALAVPDGRLADAVGALVALADRARSGVILWSEPAPQAGQTLAALAAAGIAVAIVTNSDGHGEENLRDAGICQVGAGAGASVAAVLDSAVVGSTKPDPAIFRLALERVGVGGPEEAVHVGDTLAADVAGAQAAGIVPIHLDPMRGCRGEHRHIRTLRGLWNHVAPAGRRRRVRPGPDLLHGELSL